MKILYLTSGGFISLALLTGCAPFDQNKSKEEAIKIEKEPITGTTSLSITDNNLMHFDKQVSRGSDQETLKYMLNAYPLVIVDFYADCCGPCCSMGKTLENISKKHKNIIFLKINVDKHSKLSDVYKIRGIPVLIFFKNGVEVHRESGDIDAAKLQALMKTHLH